VSTVNTEPTAIKRFLSGVNFFSTLNDEEITDLAESCTSYRHGFGETVFNQGTYSDGLYVIRAGSVRLFSQEQGKETSMGLRKVGDTFAEIAILRNTRLEYSARTASDSELLVIPRATLVSLWERNPKAGKYMTRYAAIQTTGGLVAQLFALKGKTEKQQIENLIETIGIKRVEPAQVILQQDTCDDRRLYFIRQGEVRVIRQEGSREYRLGRLGKGESFGEQALLLSQNQPASIVAEGNTTLLVIPEATVKTIMELRPALQSEFETRIQSFEQELERQRKLSGLLPGRWYFSPEESAASGQRILKHFPLVEQEQEMDCGAACLAMICRYHGIQTTLEHLREMAGIDCEGATLEYLANAGERLGFVARGVNTTFAGLSDFNLPLIAHWQGYHYFVVYGISSHQVWIADPASGFKKMSVTEFARGWDGTCLLLDSGTDSIRQHAEPLQALSPARFLQPCRGFVLPLVAVMAILAGLTIIPPILIQYLLDSAGNLPGDNWINLLLALWMAVYGFKHLTDLLRNILVGRLEHRIGQKAKRDFLQTVLYLPLTFFEKRSTSDILARLEENENLWRFVTGQATATLADLCLVAISWIVLLFYDTRLAALFMGCLFPIMIFQVLAANRAKDRTEVTLTNDPPHLPEIIQEIETVKAQGAEYWVRSHWELLDRKNIASTHHRNRRESYRTLTLGLLQAAALGVLLWQGAHLLADNQFSGGWLIAFFMIAAASVPPFTRLTGSRLEWLKIKVIFTRIQSILELRPEQGTQEASANIILPDPKGRLYLDNLYFRYKDNTPYVLEALTETVSAGEWIHIIGPRNSGKTTLAKLLMGFYPITEGNITIDTYPIGLLEKGCLRRQIGYARQKTAVFSDTVENNVAFGIRAPQRKRIVDVCHQAELSSVINQLPGGYSHLLIGDAPALDESQQQRLGIARALYRDPAILLFDEATSRLDLKAECMLLNSLRSSYPNKTMITFSEHANSGLTANRIWMLYNGRIVESGSAEDLLKTHGLYSQSLEK